MLSSLPIHHGKATFTLVRNILALQARTAGVLSGHLGPVVLQGISRETGYSNVLMRCIQSSMESSRQTGCCVRHWLCTDSNCPTIRCRISSFPRRPDQTAAQIRLRDRDPIELRPPQLVQKMHDEFAATTIHCDLLFEFFGCDNRCLPLTDG